MVIFKLRVELHVIMLLLQQASQFYHVSRNEVARDAAFYERTFFSGDYYARSSPRYDWQAVLRRWPVLRRYLRKTDDLAKLLIAVLCHAHMRCVLF